MSLPGILLDNHGRQINYLRLAVTDRCNLRCFYCMPEEGIKYLPRKELLSYEEMERLVTILSGLGINKVRITGGEPFVRQDLISFLTKIQAIPGIKKLTITTNGVITADYLDKLRELGILSVNLSLDTLDPSRFFEITRRDEFAKVYSTFEKLLQSDFDVKINAVVMENKNIDDIVPMVELTRDHPVSVRFIEEMPFNGEGLKYKSLFWTHRKILDHILQFFPETEKLPDEPNSTSANYKVKGYQGSFGIIASYSRLFCGACNRIRITAQGILKTCLYDGGVLNIKELIRSGKGDEEIARELVNAINHRHKDGFEAEKHRKPIHESMSTIGG